jgi:hypothetical protein
MKSTIDTLFEQARKQAAISPETPLLSEQDIKRLLNTLPVPQTQQKRERTPTLQGLVQYMTEYLVVHWGRFAFAGGLGAVLLWASMEVLPNRPNTSEEIPTRQNMTQETAHKRETMTASPADKTNESQVQSRITPTKRSKASTRFAPKHDMAYREPFVLSDDTPCYNPESTRSPEEKLMREMLFSMPSSDMMTELHNNHVTN